MSQSKQTNYAIHAAGVIVAATGLPSSPPPAGSVAVLDFTGAAPAVSVYTLSVPPIAPVECVVLCTPKGVVDSTVVCTGVTPGNPTLAVFATGTAAGAVAADRAFSFAVIRVSG